MKYLRYDFLLVWGIFRKFPVQAKLSFSPVIAVCMQGEGVILSFFSKASCVGHGFASTVQNLAWSALGWYSYSAKFCMKKQRIGAFSDCMS